MVRLNYPLLYKQMRLTFCIPYYGKEEKHKDVLLTAVTQIRRFHPEERILICKTSDSLIYDFSSFKNVEVHTTFVDGSHIYGAMELLTRECTTENFLLCHDSMFLLNALPQHMLEKDLYSLWYFAEQAQYFYPSDIEAFVRRTQIPREYQQYIGTEYRHFPEREQFGLFGPAFGGKLSTLTEAWRLLDISPETIGPWLGRVGLLASERVMAILFRYMGYDMKDSLNGTIYAHPNAFDATTIPDFAEIQYAGSSMWKIWQKR